MNANPSGNENFEENDVEMTAFTGVKSRNNLVQSPEYLGNLTLYCINRLDQGNITPSHQEFAVGESHEIVTHPSAQDPLHFDQEASTNQASQETQIPIFNTNIASNPDHRFHRTFQIANNFPELPTQAQLQYNLMDEQNFANTGVNSNFTVVQQIQDLVKSMSKRMHFNLGVSKDYQEEEIMSKKFIAEDPDAKAYQYVSKPREELRPIQFPGTPSNLIAYPVDTNMNSSGTHEAAASFSSLVNSNDRGSETININTRERNECPPPMSTCFKIDLKDKTLALLSHKLKNDSFKDWKELKRVKEVSLQFPFFNLKEDKLVKNLEAFFGQFGQLEKIIIDFRYLKYDSKLRPQYEKRLDEILQTTFANQISLEHIRLFWTRPEGVEIVVKHVLQILRIPTSILRHLRLNLEGTQLPYKSLKELIQHVQGHEQNFDTFRLSADVVSPEEAPIVQSQLNMPNVKDFALNLTCLGDEPFSADLMNFIIQSVSTMKKIESLELKLVIKDYTGQDEPEVLIKRLFSNIQGNTDHLQELKVIVSLEKKDEPQDDNANLEKLIRIVVESFSPQKIKEFSIGTNPEKVRTIKKKKNIGAFWREELKKIKEAKNNEERQI